MKDETNNSSSDTLEVPLKTSSNLLTSKWKEGVFLLGVTGLSVLFGFGRTVANARKHEPQVSDNVTQTLHSDGNRLALRALRWGTFYALSGTGLICLAIWKLSGANNFDEFRAKAGSILPRLSPKKTEDPKTRTEFANLTDLIQYIIDEDVRNAESKASKPNPSDQPTNTSTNSTN